MDTYSFGYNASSFVDMPISHKVRIIIVVALTLLILLTNHFLCLLFVQAVFFHDTFYFYDLCINSSVLGVDGTVRLVTQFVEDFETRNCLSFVTTSFRLSESVASAISKLPLNASICCCLIGLLKLTDTAELPADFTFHGELSGRYGKHTVLGYNLIKEKNDLLHFLIFQQYYSTYPKEGVHPNPYPL